VTAWLIRIDFPAWHCCLCGGTVPWADAIVDAPRGALFAVRHPACDEELAVFLSEAAREPCGFCGRPVVWALEVVERRRLPIEPAVVADGNVVQMRREGTTPGVRFLSAEERVSRQGARYWSHAGRCPERPKREEKNIRK